MDMKLFFDQLKARGIRILLDDNGALRVKGKKEQLDAELVAQLKANKSEIANHLKLNPLPVAVVPEVAVKPSHLSDAQTKQLVEQFNDTQLDRFKTDAFSDLTLHGMVEAQVVDNPNKIAVEFKDGRLTYAQLNRQANKLASFLRREGVEADTVVGIGLSPGVNQIMVMLAVLKAGGAYLPICPTKAVLPDGGALDFLLTQKSLLGQFAILEVPTYSIDDNETKQAIECCAPANPQVLETQNALALACVLFGIDTQGDERGVMIEHGNIITLVDSPNYISLTANDVVAHCAPIDSDAGLFEIWGALANGATLIEIDRNLQSSAMMLKQALNIKNISVMLLPMPLFSHLASLRPDCFARLDCLLISGLPIDVAAVNNLINGGKPKHLVHLFGVLENTTFSTHREIVDKVDANVLGKPVSAANCFILDEARQLVEQGKPGTLYVGGFGLVRGYVGDWRDTEQAFLPSPFSDDPNDRIFATSLKAKYTEDGTIELTEPVRKSGALWPLPSKPSLTRSSEQQQSKGRFYQNVWQSQPLNTLNKSPLLPGGCFLLLCDNYGLGDRLAQSLRLQSQQVISVRAGQKLKQIAQDDWMVNPSSEQDYKELLLKLTEQGIERVQVLHLWSIAALDTLAPCEPVFEQLAQFETHLQKGLYSVEKLKQAFDTSEIHLELINLVTRQSYSITSDERLLPSAATIAAMANKKQGIVQIDLGLDEMPPKLGKVEQLSDFIGAELTVEQRAELVAYRGKQRWKNKPTSCSVGFNTATALHSAGHYLIIAEQLMDAQALIEQINQSVVSAKIYVLGLWSEDDFSADHVVYIQARSFNNGDLSEAMMEVRERCGNINGVVFCPKNDSDDHQHVQSLLNIDEQIRNAPIEFCVVMMADSETISDKVNQIYTQTFVQNKHHFGDDNWLHLVYKAPLSGNSTLLPDLLQMERTPCLTFNRQ